jgi:hypothetical protein
MNVRQLVIPVAAEAYATLTLPESMTPEALERVEREAARLFEACRREGRARLGVDPGALEYASWSILREGRA